MGRHGTWCHFSRFAIEPPRSKVAGEAATIGARTAMRCPFAQRQLMPFPAARVGATSESHTGLSSRALTHKKITRAQQSSQLVRRVHWDSGAVVREPAGKTRRVLVSPRHESCELQQGAADVHTGANISEIVGKPRQVGVSPRHETREPQHTPGIMREKSAPDA